MTDNHMVHMVLLQSKSGNLKQADITVSKLIDLLASRGMPPVEILKFDKRLQEELHIDGAGVYAEFADIIFSPYSITRAEADRRLLERN